MNKPRLQNEYEDRIKSALIDELDLDNVMTVPRLDKIVLNMGVGEASQDSKKITQAVDQLARVSGQQPVITRAKKSVSQFKIRQGMPIGCKVTLRRERMYEFLDRLVTIALPRQRDFRGVNPKSFDGQGNYALGIKEQIVFPEINYDDVDEVRGMDIVICTNANDDDHARVLLSEFNMPFRK